MTTKFRNGVFIMFAVVCSFASYASPTYTFTDRDGCRTELASSLEWTAHRVDEDWDYNNRSGGMARVRAGVWKEPVDRKFLNTSAKRFIKAEILSVEDEMISDTQLRRLDISAKVIEYSDSIFESTVDSIFKSRFLSSINSITNPEKRRFLRFEVNSLIALLGDRSSILAVVGQTTVAYDSDKNDKRNLVVNIFINTSTKQYVVFYGLEAKFQPLK